MSRQGRRNDRMKKATILILLLYLCSFVTACTGKENETMQEKDILTISENTSEQEPEVKAETTIYREGSMPSLEKRQEFLDVESLRAQCERYTLQEGDLYGITPENESILIRNYNKYYGEKKYISIPDTVEGCPVIGIAEDAVSDDIWGIVLPGAMRIVEDEALEIAVSDLWDINIPESLEVIGNKNDIAWQTDLWYGGWEDTEEKMIIRNGHLFYCSMTDNRLKIPEGVRVIAEEAFADCTSTELILPEGLEEIYSLPSNLEVMNVPDSLIRIEFRNKEQNTPWFQDKIEQADNGFVIINGILLYCGLETEEVNIPEGVWSINAAFTGNQSLQTITMPEGVKEIGTYAFAGCENLKNAVLPKSLIKIGDGAFRGCAMEGIILPENVKSIGRESFSHCSSLKNIILPEGLKEIGREAFESCIMLEEIMLPGSVAVLGERAFASCTALEKIELTEGLKYMGEFLFEECIALTEIQIPDSVEFIGMYAFMQCPNIRYIRFGQNKVYIEQELFRASYSGDLMDRETYEAAIKEETVIEIPEQMPYFLPEQEKMPEHVKWKMWSDDNPEWTCFSRVYGIDWRENTTFIVHRDSPAEELIKQYQFRDGKEMYQYRYYDE